jgi:pimeloyl-[acyl-carrier protein] methyl ester esterase
MSRILLVHGWGFDPRLWDPLRATLPGQTWLPVDLGYFGPARTDLPPVLDLVVGHSFGCLWAMAHPDLAGIPLLAVNGFARFAAATDYPHGTPLRVLDRMLKRLQEAPREVLVAFHARCSTAPPQGDLQLPRLALDLQRMRDEDARAVAARQPILACAAEDDPLVAADLAREAFAGRLRMLPGGGHALPLTRPGALAQVILEVLGR